MNKYKITTFSYGQLTAYIVEAFDMSQALSMVNQQEVIKIEIFEAINIIDTTEQG